MNTECEIVNNFIQAQNNFFRDYAPKKFDIELAVALDFYEKIEFSTNSEHKLMRTMLERRFEALLDKASLAIFEMGLLPRLYRTMSNPVLLSNALHHGFGNHGSSMDKRSLGLIKEVIELGGVPSAHSYMAKDDISKPINGRVNTKMALDLYANIKRSLDAIDLQDQHYSDTNIHPLSTFITRLVKQLLKQKQFKVVAKIMIEDAEYLRVFDKGVAGLGKYGFFTQIAMHNIWSHDLLKEVYAHSPEVYHEVMRDLSTLLIMHMASGSEDRLHLEKLPFTPAFGVPFCKEACKQGILSMRLRPEEFKILNRWSKQQGGDDLAVFMSTSKEVKKLVTRYLHLVDTLLPQLRKKPEDAVTYGECMSIIARNPVVLETLFIPEEKRLESNTKRMLDAFNALCYAGHGKGGDLLEFYAKHREIVCSRAGVIILENFMLKLASPVFGKDSKGYGIVQILADIVANKEIRHSLADMTYQGYQMLHTIVPSKDRDLLTSIAWNDPRIKRSLLENDMAL
jgi:hypothetical protein